MFPSSDRVNHYKMSRHSGLQKDVLKLYRVLLRTAQTKDPRLVAVVAKEFRAKAVSVEKKDFNLIEHYLRFGYKQKKLIEMPGFNSAGIVGEK
jgi:hypothetical protein